MRKRGQVSLDSVSNFPLLTTKPKRMSRIFFPLEVRLVFLSRVDDLGLKSAQNGQIHSCVDFRKKLIGNHNLLGARAGLSKIASTRHGPHLPKIRGMKSISKPRLPS